MKYLFTFLICFSFFSCRQLSKKELVQELKTELRNSPQIYNLPNHFSEKDIKTLSLDKAKGIALANNPSLKIALARIEGAEAQLRQARSSFLPQLSAQSSASHQHYQPRSLSFSGADSFENYNSSLNVNWLILDGFRREHQELSARYNKMALEFSFRDSQRLLVQAVSTSFYQALLAHEQVKISQSDEEFNQKLLTDNEKRYRAGVLSETEVLNFRSRVKQAQIARLNFQRDYQNALSALFALLGLDNKDFLSGCQLSPLSEGQFSTEPLKATSADLLNDHQRPDLHALAANIKAAEAIIKAERGTHMPRLSTQASYGFSERNQLEWSSDERSSSYGLAVNWDLFTGGRQNASVDEAKAKAKEIKANLKREWLNVQNQVTQQKRQVNTAIKKVSLQRGIAQDSEKIFSKIQARYRVGEETITRVNEALNELTRQQQNLLITRIEVLLSRENLLAELGLNLPAIKE